MPQYVVLFAPDGENFQEVKKGSIEAMTDYFNGPDITTQLALNQFAKFKLVNANTRISIAERPPKNQQGKV